MWWCKQHCLWRQKAQANILAPPLVSFDTLNFDKISTSTLSENSLLSCWQEMLLSGDSLQKGPSLLDHQGRLHWKVPLRTSRPLEEEVSSSAGVGTGAQWWRGLRMLPRVSGSSSSRLPPNRRRPFLEGDTGHVSSLLTLGWHRGKEASFNKGTALRLCTTVWFSEHVRKPRTPRHLPWLSPSAQCILASPAWLTWRSEPEWAFQLSETGRAKKTKIK